LPPARLRIEVHQCSLLVRDAEPLHARRDLRAPGDLGRREHGAGISVITVASRFEDFDASLRLRAIAIQIRFQRNRSATEYPSIERLMRGPGTLQ
jgi:hypothetical protein